MNSYTVAVIHQLITSMCYKICARELQTIVPI